METTTANLPEVDFPHFWYNNKIYGSREEVFDDMLLREDYNGTMEFRFAEHVFGKMSWMRKIDISISNLYKLRAQQLRDKYDYIILMFSGGSDSTQMLYSFIKNKIFVDEILVINNEKLANAITRDQYLSDKELQQLLEYDLAVKPVLELVKKVSPNTKITIVDTSDYAISQFTSISKQEVLVGKSKDVSTTSSKLFVSRPHIYQFYANKHVLDTAKLGRSTCLLRGFEKPILIIDNDELFGVFTDIMMISGRMYAESKHYTLENFYWTADFPLIVIKQSQMIKHELETNKDFYERYTASKKKMAEHKDVFVHSPAYMIERELSRIIYPNFSPRTFAAIKTIWLPAEAKAIKYLGYKNFTEDMILDIAKEKENKYSKIVNKSQFSGTLYTRWYFLGKLEPKWS